MAEFHHLCATVRRLAAAVMCSSESHEGTCKESQVVNQRPEGIVNAAHTGSCRHLHSACRGADRGPCAKDHRRSRASDSACASRPRGHASLGADIGHLCAVDGCGNCGSASDRICYLGTCRHLRGTCTSEQTRHQLVSPSQRRAQCASTSFQHPLSPTSRHLLSLTRRQLLSWLQHPGVFSETLFVAIDFVCIKNQHNLDFIFF